MRKLTTELDGTAPRAIAAEYEYFRGNYRDQLKPSMGVEMIYELLAQVGQANRWVDLGAGPFSALWGLGIPTVERLTAVDSSPLNLWLNNHYWMDMLDGVYVASLVDAGLVSETARDRMRALHRCYLVGDVFEPSEGVAECGEPVCADVVTAIGLLGLARNSSHVAKALRTVCDAARSGGSFVGASWVRHNAPTPAFALDWPDRLGQLSELTGLRLEYTRRVALADDNDFAAVFGWTMSVRDGR